MQLLRSLRGYTHGRPDDVDFPRSEQLDAAFWGNRHELNFFWITEKILGEFVTQVDLPTLELTFFIDGTPGWVVGFDTDNDLSCFDISAKVLASAGTEAKEKINTRMDTAISNLFITSSF